MDAPAALRTAADLLEALAAWLRATAAGGTVGTEAWAVIHALPTEHR